MIFARLWYSKTPLKELLSNNLPLFNHRIRSLSYSDCFIIRQLLLVPCEVR